MLPILLKLLPVGKIARFLLLAVLLSAGLMAGGILLSDTVSAQEVPETPTADEEQETSVWDRTINEFDTGVTIHDVIWNTDEEVAEVYLSLDEDATESETVILTDGTRDVTGYADRNYVTLDPDERGVYEVDMYDVSDRAISVDSRELFIYTGESLLKLSPQVDNGNIVLGLGIFATMLILVGINQVKSSSTRGVERKI